MKIGVFHPDIGISRQPRILRQGSQEVAGRSEVGGFVDGRKQGDAAVPVTAELIAKQNCQVEVGQAGEVAESAAPGRR